MAKKKYTLQQVLNIADTWIKQIQKSKRPRDEKQALLDLIHEITGRLKRTKVQPEPKKGVWIVRIKRTKNRDGIVHFRAPWARAYACGRRNNPMLASTSKAKAVTCQKCTKRM